MATFEYNPEDFTTEGQAEADKSLLVKFFIKPFQDKEATLREGRPIYKDREYIDIRAPGDRLGGVCRPATLRDARRFPLHYQKFKARVENSEEKVDGTLLTEWPQITRSQAEELSFFHVKTVEQLARMAEVHAGKMMNFHTLKRKANEWLESTKGNADKVALQEELHKRDMEIEALKSTVAQLLAATPAPAQAEAPRDEIAELRAMVEQLAKNQTVTRNPGYDVLPVAPSDVIPAAEFVKRKPGRPKVIKTE